MQIGVLEPKDFSKKALTDLSKLGTVSLFEDNSVESFIKDKEVLFVRLNHFIDRSILDRANNLKFICTPTTGLNHIDVQYALSKNIRLISLKGEVEFLSDIRATSEHTFGLILALLRNYKNSFIRNRIDFNRDKYKGFEIFDNHIGIIGFGRIGKRIAKYVEGFDGICRFFDINKNVESFYGAIRVDSLTDLIDKSTVICLCASYEVENEKFISDKIIDQMKGKYFINTARGELVDEGHLIKRINENYFKGVAVDVLANESESNNNLDNFLAITSEKNFILTPHIAGATFTSMERTEEFIVNKLKVELRSTF